MKMTRKLIPALAMLLISAVMLSTASFAWFSMNDKVSASGMQIKAKSEQTFLLISAEKTTASEIQAEADADTTNNGRLVELQTAATEVYPAAVRTEDGASTNSGNMKFHYAVGKSYEKGEAQGSYTIIESGLNNYVVEYVFYITVAKGAAAATNLVVSGLTINGDEAVSVAVATETKAYVYTRDENGNLTVSGNDVITADQQQITQNDVLAVHVYVYYNGEHDSVTTANAANLTGATVSITFGVKDAGENS